MAPSLALQSLGQHLGVLLVAIDRFTQFITPVFYIKLWGNNRLKKAIFLHWFLSFCCGVAFYWEKPILTINITENGTTVVHENQIGFSILILISALIMTLIAFIVLLCYGAIFIKAIIISVQDNSDTAQRMALNTVIIGFSISACLLCFVGFAFLSIFGIDVESYHSVFQIFGELYTGLNPYCLLVFAKNFRKNFKQLYFCNGCGVKVGTQNPNHHEKPIEMKSHKPRLVPRSARAKVHIV